MLLLHHHVLLLRHLGLHLLLEHLLLHCHLLLHEHHLVRAHSHRNSGNRAIVHFWGRGSPQLSRFLRRGLHGCCVLDPVGKKCVEDWYEHGAQVDETEAGWEASRVGGLSRRIIVLREKTVIVRLKGPGALNVSGWILSAFSPAYLGQPPFPDFANKRRDGRFVDDNMYRLYSSCLKENLTKIYTIFFF